MPPQEDFEGDDTSSQVPQPEEQIPQQDSQEPFEADSLGGSFCIN
jgi:hypothetical protein